jgi:hypothetical protein
MSLTKGLRYLIFLVVGLAFAGFLLLAFQENLTSAGEDEAYNLFLVVMGLILAAGVAYRQMWNRVVDYAAAFHDISSEVAGEFLYWQTIGPEDLEDDDRYTMPKSYRMPKILRVQSGKADLDGPPVVLQVGGPAKLSIDHDSAVVTARRGRLNRVFGPGFHDLQPYERVWNVIDLRPQRRTITVEFMTRDAIPASCQASIVCRVAGPGSRLGVPGDGDGDGPSYPYFKDAIFKLSTSAYVRSREGADRVSDWMVGMANGALDGAVRDVLEQYRLDEFLNPQYWLGEEDGPSRIMSSPQLHTKLESEIETMVRETGRQRGVIVERVELGVVRPEEKSISRQWLDFWQAKLQKRIDLYSMSAETNRTELAEQALVEARVGFINRILVQIQDLQREDQPMIPPELFITSVVDVLTGMVDHGPEFQRMSFNQIENLRNIVDVTQKRAQNLPPMDDETPQLTADDDVSGEDVS